jgi:hypothetical protein
VLRVRVLGDLTVELDGTASALPSSVKVRAVLAWLALHPGMQPRSSVAARLWPDVLDASARASLAEEAEAELRAATLEPLGPSDFPATLVPRLARVQGLVAAARGDRAKAEAHLREAATGWRRQLDAGERGTYWLDLGRPPVAGLVEPDRSSRGSSASWPPSTRSRREMPARRPARRHPRIARPARRADI